MHPSLEGLHQNSPSYIRNGAHFRTAPSPLRSNQNYSRFNDQAATTPYPGFVQRVKTLLEGRASSDNVDRPLSTELLKQAGFDHDQHQTAQVLEPFATASPYSAATVATSPQDRRLTRDMVRAALGTSSDAEPLSSPNLLDSTMLIPDEPEADSSSLPAVESDAETAASSTDNIGEHKNDAG